MDMDFRIFKEQIRQIRKHCVNVNVEKDEEDLIFKEQDHKENYQVGDVDKIKDDTV